MRLLVDSQERLPNAIVIKTSILENVLDKLRQVTGVVDQVGSIVLGFEK